MAQDPSAAERGGGGELGLMAALAGMMGSGGSVEGQLKARRRSWASVLRLEGRAKFPGLTSARGQNGSRATSRRDPGTGVASRRGKGR